MEWLVPQQSGSPATHHHPLRLSGETRGLSVGPSCAGDLRTLLPALVTPLGVSPGTVPPTAPRPAFQNSVS